MCRLLPAAPGIDCTYDVMSPMDKYLATDKDNMFVGWKWTTVYRRAKARAASSVINVAV